MRSKGSFLFFKSFVSKGFGALETFKSLTLLGFCGLFERLILPENKLLNDYKLEKYMEDSSNGVHSIFSCMEQTDRSSAGNFVRQRFQPKGEERRCDP